MNKEQRRAIWAVIAQSWTHTTYASSEREPVAAWLAATGLRPLEVYHIAILHVVSAFTVFAWIALGSFGLCLPDFVFPEKDAQEKVACWHSRYLVWCQLKPLWLLGYPVSLLFLLALHVPVRLRLTTMPRSSPKD